MRTFLFLLVISSLVALSSCARAPERTGSDSTPPPGSTPAPTPAADTSTVTGTVVSKDDRVPADGGVTLVIQPDTGDSVTIEFESLFTLPSPPPARHELYQKTVPINAGDRVRVVTTRKGSTLRLEDIQKVE